VLYGADDSSPKYLPSNDFSSARASERSPETAAALRAADFVAWHQAPGGTAPALGISAAGNEAISTRTAGPPPTESSSGDRDIASKAQAKPINVFAHEQTLANETVDDGYQASQKPTLQHQGVPADPSVAARPPQKFGLARAPMPHEIGRAPNPNRKPSNCPCPFQP